jgi:lipoprotein-releasing system permease protein
MRAKKKEGIISFTAFISMLGIAIGVCVLIVVIAVMSGFDRYLEDKIIGTNSHLLVEFYDPESDIDGFAQQLIKIKDVQAVAPFISGQAFIKTGTQVTGTEIRGIDSKAQEKVSRIKEYLSSGSLPSKENEITAGKEFLLRVGLSVGDKISLISPVTLKPSDFIIAGVFNTGMYTYDASLVLANIAGLRQFYNMPSGVNGFAVRATDIKYIEKIKKDIYQKIKSKNNFEVLTWADANRNFLNALKLEKIVMFIVVTMTTVVAAFGIVSAMIMSVMAKIKDIGILRSVGARSSDIVMIFLFQGLSIGIMGIALGAFLGVVLSSSLNNIVDFISRLLGRSLIPQDIYYFDRIPTHLGVSDVNFIWVAALLISLAASIYPAYYASKINTSEALRHE